jgi:FKBP-type peptidyl-prolyl cis-trans isomerase FklB
MGIADKLFRLRNDKANENLKAGKDFLAINLLRPGVTELPSGLQYEVMTEGEGVKPSSTDKVTCHYHGTLIDGTVFDSSVKRGQPATFPLNAVIKGWTEGLQLMATGSKWRFFIPPQLGYGERQVSAQIGPNCTLIFEVELISVSA